MIATSAPSAASPSAIALPIPRPPPVTSATRPVESDIRCLAPARLLVGELRRALLDERRHRLVQVAGEARQHLRAVLEVDAGLQAADLELAPHDLLRHAHAERAVADDQLGRLERGRRRTVAIGDDPRHEPDAVGFGRVDEAAGEQQLERARRADEARQHPRHADVAAREPDADERDVEARRSRPRCARRSRARARARRPTPRRSPPR